MNGLLLGVIIGGLIGLGGSAIQGYYSLKGRREENLSRERQQSTQIQHEKDSQLISRRIAVRSRYLDPLSSHLSSLHTSIDNYEEKLIGILSPYYRDCRAGEEIQVPEVNKQEFMQRLGATKSTFKAIGTPRDKILEVSAQIADVKLLKEVDVLMDSIPAFYTACAEMYTSLNDSTTGQDSVYDFKAIMESIINSKVAISSVHHRIESLLAGVEEDDK